MVRNHIITDRINGHLEGKPTRRAIKLEAESEVSLSVIYKEDRDNQGVISMQCERCKNQMIVEDFLDLRADTEQFRFEGWRCLICGEVSDPIIEAHRKQQIPLKPSRKRRSVVAVN